MENYQNHLMQESSYKEENSGTLNSSRKLPHKLSDSGGNHNNTNLTIDTTT